MKKLRYILALVLALVIACPCAGADSSVTIYAPDGRSASVDASELELYQSLGWYAVPVCVVYAPDGRSAVIYSSELDAYVAAGWYAAPVTVMYSADGRSIVVYSSEIEAYKAVGWYIHPQNGLLPINVPLELLFSSGAGAWYTGITLYADGTFDGEFSDTNMGESGPGHPHGTRYVCRFRGKFSNIVRMNDYSYSMVLSNITTSEPAGRSRIENLVKIITFGPYGIEGGSRFVFYTPDAPASAMSDEFLSWWPYRFERYQPNTLSYYGLYNVNTGEGFFGRYE